jgi:hypothetical protein
MLVLYDFAHVTALYFYVLKIQICCCKSNEKRRFDNFPDISINIHYTETCTVTDVIRSIFCTMYQFSSGAGVAQLV